MDLRETRKKLKAVDDAFIELPTRITYKVTTATTTWLRYRHGFSEEVTTLSNPQYYTSIWGAI